MSKIVFIRVEFKDDTGDSYINGIVKDIQEDEQVKIAEKVRVG